MPRIWLFLRAHRKSVAMKMTAVILAAGFGTRMKSALPKVMHPLLGRPLVDWAVRAVQPLLDAPPVLVVGHGREQVQQLLGDRCQYVVQEELLGTGHAVWQAEQKLRGAADVVLVTYGDMPLLRTATLEQLLAHFARARTTANPAIAMLTVTRDDPQGFGRIVRDDAGAIVAIVEEADCTPQQKLIRELNPGVYCFDAAWLWDNLPRLTVSAKGEYYLTDLVGMAVAQGRAVVTAPAPTAEVDGVNTRIHLAQAGVVLQRRILEQHMLAGVTIVDPATTYIEDTVTIGMDTVVLPGCTLQGETAIGARCQIGPYTQIVDSALADECRATYSVIEAARMDAHAEIGPFGHLRKGAHLGEGVHMGNFGEVKDSYLAPGVKMGHFSYIGNAQIGANVNIGAGTITCNYDGKNKNKTVVGDDVFIGSDTLLVAPVTLGARARTGAGSVVTRDVPAETLVYGTPARPAVPRDQ
jgi:bifunctional UDP-N-acetylglucosamine pyrophosphorylase/glucosamine-1-phosphate N-acetyltransferase